MARTRQPPPPNPSHSSKNKPSGSDGAGPELRRKTRSAAAEEQQHGTDADAGPAAGVRTRQHAASDAKVPAGKRSGRNPKTTTGDQPGTSRHQVAAAPAAAATGGRLGRKGAQKQRPAADGVEDAVEVSSGSADSSGPSRDKRKDAVYAEDGVEGQEEEDGELEGLVEEEEQGGSDEGEAATEGEGEEEMEEDEVEEEEGEEDEGAIPVAQLKRKQGRPPKQVRSPMDLQGKSKGGRPPHKLLQHESAPTGNGKPVLPQKRHASSPEHEEQGERRHKKARVQVSPVKGAAQVQGARRQQQRGGNGAAAGLSKGATKAAPDPAGGSPKAHPKAQPNAEPQPSAAPAARQGITERKAAVPAVQKPAAAAAARTAPASKAPAAKQRQQQQQGITKASRAVPSTEGQSQGRPAGRTGQGAKGNGTKQQPEAEEEPAQDEAVDEPEAAELGVSEAGEGQPHDDDQDEAGAGSGEWLSGVDGRPAEWYPDPLQEADEAAIAEAHSSDSIAAITVQLTSMPSEWQHTAFGGQLAEMVGLEDPYEVPACATMGLLKRLVLRAFNGLLWPAMAKLYPPGVPVTPANELKDWDVYGDPSTLETYGLANGSKLHLHLVRLAGYPAAPVRQRQGLQQQQQGHAQAGAAGRSQDESGKWSDDSQRTESGQPDTGLHAGPSTKPVGRQQLKASRGAVAREEGIPRSQGQHGGSRKVAEAQEEQEEEEQGEEEEGAGPSAPQGHADEEEAEQEADAQDAEEAALPSPKRQRRPWTAKETVALLEGMKAYGRSWSQILEEGQAQQRFVETRKGADLKDRWETLEKQYYCDWVNVRNPAACPPPVKAMVRSLKEKNVPWPKQRFEDL